jgi:hypothetical protein
MLDVQAEIDVIKRTVPRGPARVEAVAQLLARWAAEDVPAPPVAKADPATVDDPSPAYQRLMAYAQTHLDLGEVGDILAGLKLAAQEHPELRQAYEEARLACLEVTPCPEPDETDPATPPPDTQETAMPPAHADLTKGTPTAPQTATVAWLYAIDLCKAEKPSMSYVQASDQARLENPNLFKLYVHEQRYPTPTAPQVAKQAPLTYEAVLKRVDAEVTAHPEMTRMAAFVALLTAQEGTPAFPAIHQAYRKYQLGGDGLRDHDEARLASASAGK